MVDATVAEQQIEYPTDLKLLNECRQQLERMIKDVCDEGDFKMPRTYKRKARQQYLVIAKKKNKTKKEIRKGIRRQLQYVKIQSLEQRSINGTGNYSGQYMKHAVSNRKCMMKTSIVLQSAL